MLDSIIRFGQELHFPQEAIDTMAASYETIAMSPHAMELLEENIRIFWNEGFHPATDVELRLNAIAAYTSMCSFSVYLVFFAALGDTAWAHYQAAGYSRELYLNSMHDLYCKIHITYGLYGLWGLYCSDWFNDFFYMKRFGLGRLEYELSQSPICYDHPQYALSKGQKTVNIHIPASGKLLIPDVMESIHKAAGFYAKDFPEGRIAFLCDSWMLYEPIRHLLPEGGNLLKFAELFTMAENFIPPCGDDRWRIFHRPNSVPLSYLPEDTRLQRSMKAWLLEGNRLGVGYGFLYYDNGKLIKPTETGTVLL